MKNYERLYREMKEIASEAIYLANAYAGEDSKTAKSLLKKYDKIEAKEFDDRP